MNTGFIGLGAIGARIVHRRPVGAGQATKAVNQIMAAGIAQGVTEALAFGQACGLDMDKVIIKTYPSVRPWPNPSRPH